jgi:DNA repair protein RadC
MLTRRRLVAVLETLEDQSCEGCVSDPAAAPEPSGEGVGRLVRRLGWVAPRPLGPGASPEKALDVLAGASGRPRERLALLLAEHAARVCRPDPRCNECGVADACSRYRRRPPLRGLPEEGRPREKLLRRGPQELADAELLALVLGGGTPERSALELAGILLARFGTLTRLATRTPAEISAVRGMGPAKSAAVLAALDLGRRLQERPIVPGAHFSSSHDLVAHYGPRLRDRKTELFLAVLLDGKNRVLREVRISQGSLTASIVHPREVFNAAIRESAAAVVFVHNHPSGDPSPSRQDLEVTRRLVRTGEVVGIRVLDHVILGAEGHVSFADSGLLHGG